MSIHKRLVALVGVVLLLGVAEPGKAALFGPGSHWVDNVTAGTDVFPDSLLEFGVDTDLDLIPDLDARFTGGPLIVSRTSALDDSVNYPGLRSIDSHFDVIDTEIVSMTLAGVGASAGWTIRVGTGAGVSTQSLGSIAESVTNDTLADSFFDVYFEVDDTPFGKLHTNVALQIGAVIDRIQPPVSTNYVVLGGIPLPLLNESGDTVAYLTDLTSGGTAHHLITPEPSTLAIWSLLGGIGLIVGHRRRQRKAA